MDGLYAEWRHLSAEAFIRGEKWRRMFITTLWNAAVLLLAIVTPNITVAIEMLGKWGTSRCANNVPWVPGDGEVGKRRHVRGTFVPAELDQSDRLMD